jgi:hypothetical protein
MRNRPPMLLAARANNNGHVSIPSRTALDGVSLSSEQKQTLEFKLLPAEPYDEPDELILPPGDSHSFPVRMNVIAGICRSLPSGFAGRQAGATHPIVPAQIAATNPPQPAGIGHPARSEAAPHDWPEPTSSPQLYLSPPSQSQRPAGTDSEARSENGNLSKSHELYYRQLAELVTIR